MDSRKADEVALDLLFEAGQAQRPTASDAFMARLAADAETAMPQTAPAVPSLRLKTGILTRFRGLFAASGLSGAAALGVWIGFAMPDLVTTISLFPEDTAGLSVFLPDADLSVFSE